MKKIYLLVLLIISIQASAQVPSSVPSNGLVGYWGFNGNANDQSGNGNNGTVNGATLTTDRFGNANSAYSFDGVDDNINLGVNPNISLLPNTNLSISLWFKNINNSGAFISKYRNGVPDDSSFFIGSTWNNEIHFGGNGTAPFPICNSIPNSDWNNMTILFYGGNAQLYLNGIYYCNANFPINTTLSNLPLILGSTNCPINDPNCNFLNGQLDDIGIWNRALTPQEITTIYNSSQTSSYTDTCNNVSGSLTQGLVGYWPFCGNANDDSGNGNNGTVNGATLTTDRFGNVNNAYMFTNNSRIKIPFSNSLTSQTGTISAWINVNSLPPASEPQDLIFGKGWGYPQLVIRDNGKLYLSLMTSQSTSTFIESTSSINSGTWNHVVVSYSNNNFKIFINGVLENSILPNPIPNFFSFCNSEYWIGGFNHQNSCMPNDNVQNFDGKLDDIGIWNRVLSQAEVTQLYNQNQCFNNTTVTDTLIINVGQLSYTNPISYANNITIAPNPASTQININFNNITDLNGGTIKIINSLGQQVATTPITVSGTNTSMQLATWGGAGMYFVQIINPQGQIVDIKKIILQ